MFLSQCEAVQKEVWVNISYIAGTLIFKTEQTTEITKKAKLLISPNIVSILLSNSYIMMIS